ncbi:MAG: ABC transporter permease subunit [Micromonosporaceae bacterium]|nr:ABC transporter permease subunit [Micromonosporaceae bacterium]
MTSTLPTVTASSATPAGLTSGRPRLLRAELLKARTTNIWWIFGLLALAAVAASLVVNCWLASVDIENVQNPDPNAEIPSELLGPSTDLAGVVARNAANIYTSGQFFGLMLIMLFGALLITNEYFHQTATTTFLATPQRTRVILAKLGAAAVVAVVGWAVITVVSVAVGSVFLSRFLSVSTALDVWAVQRSILMNLLAYVVWAVLGIGLGALLRNQLAATLTGAGLYFLGSQAVQLVFVVIYIVIEHPLVIKSMVLAPSVASQVMISAEPTTFWLTQDGPIMGPQWWVGLIVLLAYGVVAGVVGTLLIRRRDIA